MSVTIPAGSDYVALGSSFAAGPGLKPQVAGKPRGSGRSTVNYAHLFAAERGLSLTDETFSGATIEGMLTSQLPLVPATARLVTITGGGNDLGYLGAITTGGSFLRFLFRRQLHEWLDASTLDARVAALHANFTTLLEIGRRLNEVTAAVAKEQGATFVDVGAASVDHHAWSAEPWVNRFSFRGGAPFHPNHAGMRAVASMLAQAVA